MNALKTMLGLAYNIKKAIIIIIMIIIMITNWTVTYEIGFITYLFVGFIYVLQCV